MTSVVIVDNFQDLAVALAALRSGGLARDTCILVTTSAKASELDHPVLDAATRFAAAEGFTIAHLNEVIFPRHPLAWRVADLDAEAFASAWSRATGLSAITTVTQVGRQRNPGASLLRRLTGSVSYAIAYSPEHVAAAIRGGQRILVVDAPPGFGVISHIFGGRIGQVPAAQILAARADVRPLSAEVDHAHWHTTLPRWWGRLVRSLIAPRRRAATTPTTAKARVDAALAAQQTIEFTRTMIADLDRGDGTDQTS